MLIKWWRKILFSHLFLHQSHLPLASSSYQSYLGYSSFPSTSILDHVIYPYKLCFIKGNIHLHWVWERLPKPQTICIKHQEWQKFTSQGSDTPQFKLTNVYNHRNPSTCGCIILTSFYKLIKLKRTPSRGPQGVWNWCPTIKLAQYSYLVLNYVRMSHKSCTRPQYLQSETENLCFSLRVLWDYVRAARAPYLSESFRVGTKL